jgi:hypothetical protein
MAAITEDVARRLELYTIWFIKYVTEFPTPTNLSGRRVQLLTQQIEPCSTPKRKKIVLLLTAPLWNKWQIKMPMRLAHRAAPWRP